MRLLGQTEKQWIVEGNESFQNICLYCTLKGNVTPQEIKESVKSVLQQNPTLKLVVQKLNGELSLCSSSNSHLPLQIFTKKREDFGLEFFHNRLNKNLDTSKSLIKIYFFEDPSSAHKNELVIFAHPVLLDAHGVVQVLNDIVKYSSKNNRLELGEENINQVAPSLDSILYLENRIKGNFGFFKEVVEKVSEDIWTKPTFFEPRFQSRIQETHTLHSVIDASVFQKLKAKCVEKNIPWSVAISYLCGAISAELLHLFGVPSGTQRFLKLSNLRRLALTKSGLERMGNYSLPSLLSFDFLDSQSYWKNIRSFQKLLLQNKKSRFHFNNILFFEPYLTWNKAFGRETLNNFALEFVQDQQQNNYKSISCEGIRLSRSLKGIKSCTSHTFIERNNKLYMTFSFLKNYLTIEDGTFFTNLFHEKLEKIVDHNNGASQIHMPISRTQNFNMYREPE